MKWDFERGFLAFMAVLILAGLGGIAWMESQASKLIDNKGRAELALSDVGRLTQDVYELQQELDDDRSIQEGAYSYFENMQITSRIGGNSFVITESGDEYASEGYAESVYNLRPRGNKTFTREQVAKFLLNVERYTARMRVTRLRMTMSSRGGTGDQIWQPDVYVTERRPLKAN